MARPINSLILALTSRCNLRCHYCYLGAGERGEDMDEEIIDKSLTLVSDDCHVQITGGEPCLVPKKIAYLAEQVAHHGGKKQLAIQTNGTLLNRELIRLFMEYGFQVGISLDGPPDIQEKLRGKADATLRGLGLLAEAGIPFRVTTVVSKTNIDHLDRLALLLAGFPNCRGIGLDLLVNKGRGSTVKAAGSMELGRGMERLKRSLTFINKSRFAKLRLRELDLVNCGGRRKFCRAASGESLAVAPDGSLFPCGQAMGAKELSLGTIDHPILSDQQLTSIVLTGQHCRDCPLIDRCPGDCPSRLFFNGKPEENPVCAMYKELAEKNRENY